MQIWICPVLKVISKINKNNDSFDGQYSYQPKNNGEQRLCEPSNSLLVTFCHAQEHIKYFHDYSWTKSYSRITSGIIVLESASNNSSIEQPSIWYHGIYVVYAHALKVKSRRNFCVTD